MPIPTMHSTGLGESTHEQNNVETIKSAEREEQVTKITDGTVGSYVM